MSNNELLLDWSDQQRRILTANGKAVDYYQASRGFPFHKHELPHFYMFGSHETNAPQQQQQQQQPQQKNNNCPIVGVWKRPLFVGESEHAANEDWVYNIQTHTWFVDLRIPCTRPVVVSHAKGMELRLLARQHVFGGWTHCTMMTDDRPGCVGYARRYHALDWNYLGNPRNRPNQWWMEIVTPPDNKVWKERSFATNDAGESYYWEQWESVLSTKNRNNVVVALRRCGDCDGIVVIVEDHFNFVCHNVTDATVQAMCQRFQAAPQQVIDEAVERGDLKLARQVLLRMTGGHGRIQNNHNNSKKEWRIDLCTEPWKENTLFWKNVQVTGDDIDSCRIHWQGDEWKVVECNLSSVKELKRLLFDE